MTLTTTRSSTATESRIDAFARVARSALVSDVLDALGVPGRCLPPGIGLLAGAAPVVGRARTVSCVEVSEAPELPYQGLLTMIDGVGPGDLVLMPTGGSAAAAVWGELIATATAHRGAAGVITDGYVRDLDHLIRMGFPTFARGAVPIDSNGRFEVVGTGQPVTIGNVLIAQGELLVADRDGVVAIPGPVETDVIDRVLEKAGAEDDFRAAVRSGTPASEAFRRLGVL